jgi:hypothetical protein
VLLVLAGHPERSEGPAFDGASELSASGDADVIGGGNFVVMRGENRSLASLVMTNVAAPAIKGIMEHL